MHRLQTLQAYHARECLAEGTQSNRAARSTQSKGASTEFSFTGTGIDYIGEKAVGLGDVDIFLNGEHQGTISLLVDDFPVLLGVTLYSKQGLSGGKHTLKLVCHSDARINLEGFRVYV